MNFLSKYNLRTLRTAYLAIAGVYIILFLVIFIRTVFINSFNIDDCLWIDEKKEGDTVSYVLITEIIPGGVADTAGIIDGDILLAINGETFKTSWGAQAILNRFNDETVTYTILRNGETLDIDIAIYRFIHVQFLIVAIIGFNFLIIGVIVGYANPRSSIPLHFFLLGCTAPFGLTLFAQSLFLNVVDQFTTWRLLFATLSIVFYPLWVHFFMNFPERIEFKFRKSIIAVIYLLAFIPLMDSGDLGFVFCVAYILAGLGLFFYSFTKIKDAEKRKPLKVIILGLIIGFVGLIYFTVLVTASNRPAFLINPLLMFPTILSFAIPFSFGYSIIKYKILDTETVIKRGIAFTIITIFIVCIYLVIALALNTIFMRFFDNAAQLSTIISIVIITFSYDFVNKKVKSFVDKQFYKERYNYRKSLLEFAEQMPYFKNVNEVLSKLVKSVSETIGIKTINIWLNDKDYYKLVKPYEERFTRNVIDNPSQYNKAILSLFTDENEPILITDTFLRDTKIDSELRKEFKEDDVVLLVPMNIYDKIIGILKFGKKPSGKAYSEEDIDLLKTLTSQVAISFENNRLQQEELKRTRIEEELLIAKNIQESLLPEWESTNDEISISYYSKPAREIGGDFYDFIEIDEHRFYVVIADVSGKGIPAALYMSKVQSMIQLASNIFHSPKEILVEVNKNIKDQLDKFSFVTCIVALFDLNKMTVKISRAGHNPVIYNGNGEAKFIKSKGIGLNLADEHTFGNNLEEIELPLKYDDLFVFYSDGLSEAMNQQRKEYGDSNLLEIVGVNNSCSPDEVRDRIMNSVNEFTSGAEQHDDITMVILKINEK